MCRSLGRKYNPLPSLISNLNFGPLCDTSQLTAQSTSELWNVRQVAGAATGRKKDKYFELHFVFLCLAWGLLARKRVDVTGLMLVSDTWLTFLPSPAPPPAPPPALTQYLLLHNLIWPRLTPPRASHGCTVTPVMMLSNSPTLLLSCCIGRWEMRDEHPS